MSETTVQMRRKALASAWSTNTKPKPHRGASPCPSRTPGPSAPTERHPHRRWLSQPLQSTSLENRDICAPCECPPQGELGSGLPSSGGQDGPFWGCQAAPFPSHPNHRPLGSCTKWPRWQGWRPRMAQQQGCRAARRTRLWPPLRAPCASGGHPHLALTRCLSWGNQAAQMTGWWEGPGC